MIRLDIDRTGSDPRASWERSAPEQRPPADEAQKARAYFERPLGYSISDTFLGKGCQKAVFASLDDPGVAVRLLRNRSHGILSRLNGTRNAAPWDDRRLASFKREHDNLALAREWGLPTTEILAHGTVQTARGPRPADAVQRAGIGSKELWKMRREDPSAYREITQRMFGGEQGQAALTLLDRFASAFSRGLVIEDFQLMMSPGRVDYADSSGIYSRGAFAGLATFYWRLGQGFRLRQIRRMVEDGQ